MNVRRTLSGELARAGIQTYALTVAALVANLVSGIVVARGLAPEGRGETIAIAMLAQNAALLFSLGCAKAVSYRYALRPEDGGRLLTAWAVILVPLTALGILAGELTLPVLFDAQSEEAIDIAQVYLFTVALVLLGELVNGMLLGAADYFLANALRVVQPALTAAAQLALWIAGELTVESALLAAVGASVVSVSIGLRRALQRTGGFGPFDWTLARETASYGFRGQGAVLAGQMNQRLDLLIMPAFLGAASVGLYSIAANVSLIVYMLAQQLRRADHACGGAPRAAGAGHDRQVDAGDRGHRRRAGADPGGGRRAGAASSSTARRSATRRARSGCWCQAPRCSRWGRSSSPACTPPVARGWRRWCRRSGSS